MTNLSGTNLNNGAAVGPQGEGMDSPSTFPKYPAYKDSGVEWLGAVPESWKVAGVKFFADLITGITPPSDDLDNYAEEGWPWVRPEDLNDSGKPVLASKFLTDQGWRFCRKVQGGSTLICCIGTIGKIGFVDSDVCTNQQITAVVPRGNGRFFFYAMQALKPAFDVSATGNVLRILNSERLGNVTMAVPDHSVAESIARFLDHETARIDALIEEQQRLIELLKEKRQAVISHAVTKGLDPAAPMKDSGVEWLGEVPAHWELFPIKHLALLNPRKSGFAGDTGQLCSFVPMEKLKTGVLVLDEERPIEEVIGGYTYFEDGDVLQAKVTPCFENRNIAIAKGLTNGIGFGSSEINVLRPFNGVSAEYLYYRLQENSYMSFCVANMSGAGGLKRVPTDIIDNFKVAAPKLSEQIKIAQYLDRETKRINHLIEYSESGVTLLQERRSALISAAVTGKIDVRGWQPPASTQAPEIAVAEAD